MTLSPTALDRHGRPLHGSAHPDYYRDERERARQAGLELCVADEAEHRSALEEAALLLHAPADAPPEPPAPRKVMLRKRLVNLLRVGPRSTVELAQRIYDNPRAIARVYCLLADAKRHEGIEIASVHRRWHLVRFAKDGWPVCPHCGQKVAAGAGAGEQGRLGDER
jgi:hypothetical protein